METGRQDFVVSLCCLLLVIGFCSAAQAENRDNWEIVVQNAGVSAMHMALTHTNKVIIFDRTDFGQSSIKLPNGKCRRDSSDLALKVDCWAHSVEYDLKTNGIRPLMVLTDTWCSSGSFQSDGTLKQTGGWNDGGSAVRTIGAGPTDDWVEYPNYMTAVRWYATNHILPDQRQIVIGGRREYSYEFVPRAAGEGAYAFPFLQQTTDVSENNLYPFVHLSTDGNLFIFANQDSILFDYKTGTVVKKFPTLAGGARCYPSSGSAVMLPLTAADGYKAVEIMICGGSPANAFVNVHAGVFPTALQTCGRMVITAPNPQWTMQTMPEPRVLGDMLLLPTGEVLIINGAHQGTAGWYLQRSPALAPILYNPANDLFITFQPSTIPRVYHSTALVLPDGKILVAGSNTNERYTFKGVLFPTELRIEKYSPYYLHYTYDSRRPQITAVENTTPTYGAKFTVTFTTPNAPIANAFHLYAIPFVTHTYSMNQRMLVLASTAPVAAGGKYVSTLTAPPSAVIAPAGYYLLNAMNDGTPSPAVWIKVG